MNFNLSFKCLVMAYLKNTHVYEVDNYQWIDNVYQGTNS